MRRRILVLVVTVLLAAGFVTTPASASASTSTSASGRGQQSVTVSGAVARPTTFGADQLRALPQTTLPDRRSRWGGRLTGVPVADLVQAAAPVLPPGKNTALRVRVTVRGLLGARTFALGELDPGFGDHPALLVSEVAGHRLPGAPYLAVPGDRGYARTVVHVTRLDVAVAAAPVPAVGSGGIVVTADRHRTTVSAAALARLPRTSTTVTFSAGGQPQTHTESGPSLAAVLRVAHVRAGPTTAVTAIGGDDYAATVTPAEATSGRRPLLVSLVEDGTPFARPRLIAVGDLKGGRDVAGLVALRIG